MKHEGLALGQAAEQEMAQDPGAITHCFSARLYGTLACAHKLESSWT